MPTPFNASQRGLGVVINQPGNVAPESVRAATLNNENAVVFFFLGYATSWVLTWGNCLNYCLHVVVPSFLDYRADKVDGLASPKLFKREPPASFLIAPPRSTARQGFPVRRQTGQVLLRSLPHGGESHSEFFPTLLPLERAARFPHTKYARVRRHWP
ncbi:MAG: hypothetical protein WA542_19240 [Candidatus Acidiferrum sp.]